MYGNGNEMMPHSESEVDEWWSNVEEGLLCVILEQLYLNRLIATVVFCQILLSLKHHETTFTRQHVSVFRGDVSFQGLLVSKALRTVHTVVLWTTVTCKQLFK